MSVKRVSIPNISCGHCARTIQRELSELDGVGEIRIEVPARQAEIQWDESRLEWESISSLLREINYPAVEL